jgi:hypothetical protein
MRCVVRNRLVALWIVALLGSPVGSGSALAGDDCVLVEDLSKDPVGRFPLQWKARKDAGKRAYTVQEEAGRKFLHAEARDLGIQAAREFSWDASTHPVLAWSWRPRRFPEGADERSGKNDSVLAVYAVFPHTRFTVKTVKYVWSEKVPAGTHLTSSGGLTQVRVLRSGLEGLDRWVEAYADVREDYRRFFGDSEVPKPAGVAVLTDSDDTHSLAVGDYAEFRVCRRGPDE